MKITKSQLKQIIKEEIESLIFRSTNIVDKDQLKLTERSEGNPGAPRWGPDGQAMIEPAEIEALAKKMAWKIMEEEEKNVLRASAKKELLKNPPELGGARLYDPNYHKRQAVAK